jgi:hypothetical protein
MTPLALGNDRGGSDTTREVGREFCAAFHRGVALRRTGTTARRTTRAASATTTMYFHRVSLGNRSYAFAGGVVNDQSSVQILNDADPPTSLTLAIGW